MKTMRILAAVAALVMTAATGAWAQAAVTEADIKRLETEANNIEHATGMHRHERKIWLISFNSSLFDE